MAKSSNNGNVKISKFLSLDLIKYVCVKNIPSMGHI